MVLKSCLIESALSALSVLALSSRFDGLLSGNQDTILFRLSVLALSSRFDGRSR